jgi:hypothetical protein
MESSVLLDQGHVRLKQCRHGPMLYLVTDPYVGQSLDCYGEYSEEEVALLRMAYRLYWHLPPLFNPQNYFGVGENMFGRIVSVNMLGLPASVPQEVQGLHEIIDPEDRRPGELRKVRPMERRDAPPSAPSVAAVADSGGRIAPA